MPGPVVPVWDPSPSSWVHSAAPSATTTTITAMVHRVDVLIGLAARLEPGQRQQVLGFGALDQRRGEQRVGRAGAE